MTPPPTDELIDHRIELHDSNQFEVKLDYSIDPERRTSAYRIETYFYVPRSLGVNADTYGRDEFYNDIQAHIRFKTPDQSLSEILNLDNAMSPLKRMSNLIGPRQFDSNGRPNPFDDHAIVHELKMLGCLVRADVRGRTRDLSERLTKLASKGKQADRLVADIEALLVELNSVLQGYRDAGQDLLQCDALAVPTCEAYRWVDEYLSLTAESHLTVLLSTLDAEAQSVGEYAEFEILRTALTEAVLAERQHREQANYRSILQGHEEQYMYRRGTLKKYVNSVLYLDMNKEKQGKGLAEVVAASAAGIAMAFSTVAAIWSQQTYGINSFPFVIAIILAYMLKDRIKEWLKHYFSKRMAQWLPDYDLAIQDPAHDVVVGRCREAFAFIDLDQVPDDIALVRRRGASSVLDADSKPEVVMKYAKDVRIRGNRIARVHGRLLDISDIIRFNVARFLLRTDDPVTSVRSYDSESDRVEIVDCPKTYHINIVFCLRAVGSTQPPVMHRARVVLDQRGIQRIQEPQ